jgi:superfamily II DNA or RNA helicase
MDVDLPQIQVFEDELTHILRAGLTKKGHPDPNSVHPYPAQVEVNHRLWNLKEDVINVVATSQGKTETFYLYVRLARSQEEKAKGAGPVVVFCPANALLNDQVKRAKEFGFEATVFGNQNDYTASHLDGVIKKLFQTNSIDILFMTAHMMEYTATHADHKFNQVPQFGPRYNGKTGKWRFVPLLVIDEIHTIAEAGPNYFSVWLTVWSTIHKRPWYDGARKLGLTATLDTQERRSVNAFIPGAEHWQLVMGGRFRPNITIRVIVGAVMAKESRKAWVCDYLEQNNETSPSVLVFVNRVKECTEYAKAIQSVVSGGQVGVYHARLGEDQRRAVEDKFRAGEIRVLVATKAIGVGFDKPDLRVVIHTFTPPTPTEYYQQIGRAGRDEIPARAFLLPSRPWNKDSVLNAILRVAHFLSRWEEAQPKYSVKLDTIQDAMGPLAELDPDTVSKAADEGVKLQIFQRQGDLIIFPRDRDSLERFNTLLSKEKACQQKLSFMRQLNDNKGDCLWKRLLDQLDDRTITHDFRCQICHLCDGQAEDEPAVNPYAGSNKFLSLSTPGCVPVLGLGRPGVASDFSSDRILELAKSQLTGFDSIPNLWSVGFIPDGAGKVEKMARDIAASLELEVFAFVLNKNTSSMKTAKTPEQQATVLKKYSFLDTQLPPLGNILLYDDVINTGTTMDHIANYLKSKGFNVIGLVGEAYETITAEELDMTQANVPLPEEAAKMGS